MQIHSNAIPQLTINYNPPTLSSHTLKTPNKDTHHISNSSYIKDILVGAAVLSLEYGLTTYFVTGLKDLELSFKPDLAKLAAIPDGLLSDELIFNLILII